MNIDEIMFKARLGMRERCAAAIELATSPLQHGEQTYIPDNTWKQMWREERTTAKAKVLNL